MPYERFSKFWEEKQEDAYTLQEMREEKLSHQEERMLCMRFREEQKTKEILVAVEKGSREGRQAEMTAVK